jgi:Flp pilus assembly protein TadG
MLYRRKAADGNRRRGAAAAELAIIVAPVLAFVLVAGTDFARLFYSYLTITSCARNGAIYYSMTPSSSRSASQIQPAALADASGLSATPTVSSNTTGNDANGNPCVTVTVNYTFTTIVTYPGIPHTMNLSRTVEMRIVADTPN